MHQPRVLLPLTGLEQMISDGMIQRTVFGSRIESVETLAPTELVYDGA